MEIHRLYTMIRTSFHREEAPLHISQLKNFKSLDTVDTFEWILKRKKK